MLLVLLLLLLLLPGPAPGLLLLLVLRGGCIGCAGLCVLERGRGRVCVGGRGCSGAGASKTPTAVAHRGSLQLTCRIHLQRIPDITLQCIKQ